MPVKVGLRYIDIWKSSMENAVLAYALTDFPGIQIYLCGAHPSRDMDEQKLADRAKFDALLKEFAENTPDVHFIDLMNYEPMKSKDIFIEDGVHFNVEGYKRYAQLFREALKDELEKF